MSRSLPLVVALEGGLSRVDLVAEARLQRVAGRASGLNPATLPLDPTLVDLLRAEVHIRPVILIGDVAPDVLSALAARVDPALRWRVARQGSERLAAARSEGDFAFVGAAAADAKLRAAAVELIRLPAARPSVWRALRPHHWVKNLLIFVPILAAHRWDEPQLWAMAAMAFVGFCLASSAVYLANDLFDIEDDRAHPDKRHRPLASGQLSLNMALTLAGLLALASLGIGLWSGTALVLAGYGLAALIYSMRVKAIPGIDLLWLVGLYCLRLLAGGLATGIVVSGWLLAYGACVFASLALAKRFAELTAAANGEMQVSKRRGYRVGDRRILRAAGLMAAVASVGVLAVYLQAAEARRMYDRPDWLLAAGAVVLLWLLRIWLSVGRGRLRADPIIFALHDPASLAAGIGVVSVLLLSAAG